MFLFSEFIQSLVSSYVQFFLIYNCLLIKVNDTLDYSKLKRMSHDFSCYLHDLMQRIKIISFSDCVLLKPKYHDTLLLVSEYRIAMKYCNNLRSSLILAIFIMFAQVLSVTNLSIGVLDQHAFGEISGNVTKLTENAVVLNSMGRFNDALSYLDKALSIDPNL